jgi:glycosyltransferase involved in cell wall biosynthesis
MDDFLHLPNVSPSMLRPLEAELLARVSAVIATARTLVDQKRPRSGRSWYLPQGVNFDHFATRQPVPADLTSFPRPWIGFAGGVGSPVDVKLVNDVARANPEASVLLVGPVRVAAAVFEPTNVHLLGSRPYRDLPAYVQAFDVGLIPYELNPHTIAVDPLKLLEYLAAGIPVVSTDLPEVRKYRDVVQIADTSGAFLAAVRRALETSPEQAAARQALARSHDWERRAERLLEILAETV